MVSCDNEGIPRLGWLYSVSLSIFHKLYSYYYEQVQIMVISWRFYEPIFVVSSQLDRGTGAVGNDRSRESYATNPDVNNQELTTLFYKNYNV